jgi:arsenite-transporting ATPase
MLISTDQAHSLADILEVELSGEPTEVVSGLQALEIDLHLELRNYWGEIQDYITAFLRSQGFEEAVAEEFAMLPGLEELFSLLKLNQLAREGECEVVIIDCAPTGNTVRMLAFPDVVQWYMEKFYSVDRKLLRVFRPLAEKIRKVQLPDDQVLDSAESLYREIREAARILTDPGTASVRLVSNPERVVLRETERALTYLCLFGYPVDGVIINRLLTNPDGNEALKAWSGLQHSYLERARDYFYPLPVLTQPLKFGEVVGIKSLREVGESLFGSDDPTRVMFQGNPISIERADGGYSFSIMLPSARREDVDLWKKGDELILKVQGVKRNIFLPRTLASLSLSSADFEDRMLRLWFKKEEECLEPDEKPE